jgi:hypothetical protein
MAHRTPETAGWELAAASTALWRRMMETEVHRGMRQAIEWQVRKGSGMDGEQ